MEGDEDDEGMMTKGREGGGWERVLLREAVEDDVLDSAEAEAEVEVESLRDDEHVFVAVKERLGSPQTSRMRHQRRASHDAHVSRARS